MSDKTTQGMQAFIAELADILHLSPGSAPDDILRHLRNATVEPIRIPSAKAPAVECMQALAVLRSSIHAALPFDTDPHVRHACAELLAALLSGREFDTDKANITLLRAQAFEIRNRFCAAGWDVIAGGVDNSPPHTGANERWAIITCAPRG